MMAKNLFTDMGKIDYNGFILTDISKRAAIARIFRDNPAYYFEYNIVDYERAEDLANDFYGDVNFVWLVYLMNEIIDPFYDWILEDGTLDKFITQKYGAGNEHNIRNYTLNGVDYAPGDEPVGAVPVTNTEHEVRINESKRSVKIIRPQYLNQAFESIKDVF